MHVCTYMTFKVGVEEGILGNYSVLVEELESQPNLGCSTAKKHVPRRTQLTYTFAQLCQSMLCSLCYHGGFNSECRTEIPVPKARSCFRISHEESSKSCSTTKVTHQTTPPGQPTGVVHYRAEWVDHHHRGNWLLSRYIQAKAKHGLGPFPAAPLPHSPFHPTAPV